MLHTEKKRKKKQQHVTYSLECENVHVPVQFHAQIFHFSFFLAMNWPPNDMD